MVFLELCSLINQKRNDERSAFNLQHLSTALQSVEESWLMFVLPRMILRNQAQYVRRDAHRLFAFLKGVRTWRKQYGRQLASELARSYRNLHAEHLRRKLLLLIDHYPQGLMMLVILRLMPRLDRRNGRVCSLGAMD